jgi:RHH-type transcriptional regulator, rel operon repressor / antitoxin RelB
MRYLYSTTSAVGTLALRLPKEIEERLEALSRRTGRTKSFYAREAILEHLEDLEDLEDAYLAEEALAEHVSSGGRTISTEELLTRYG